MLGHMVYLRSGDIQTFIGFWGSGLRVIQGPGYLQLFGFQGMSML